jgi:8-oxo-dGTP pyrophosphatase MutT (NUDIX family)
LTAHAGQVSLPGGAVERNETTAEAAIREFHEELGNDGQTIQMLGSLSPLFVQASHYSVTPWVGVVGSRPRFERNPEEVDEILEVPLAHLFDPRHFGDDLRQYESQTYSAPCFLFQSHHIWGATCMILGELVTVIEELKE